MTLEANKLEKLEKIGIILRPSSPQIKEHFLHTKEAYESKGIEVLIDSISAGMIGVLGTEFHEMCQNVDLLVSIGGDGTLISTVRRSYGYDRPVLGINVGKLGFLTDVNPDCTTEFVGSLLAQEYRVENRLILQGNLVGEENKEFFGFNDFVITRRNISHTIILRAKIGDKVINTYKGDGLILSTPTGSTAYNLSSGGPVLYPMTPAFIVNPICPHSLTQRPLVLPAHFELEIDTVDDEGGIIIVDGQEIYELKSGDTIKVKIAPQQAKLVHRLERDYFDVLTDKLNWGDE
jgi:NAD+ kinase